MSKPIIINKKTCETCGKPVSTNKTRICRACWENRGRTENRPRHICEVCGKACSAYSKRCRACWENRTAIRKASEPDPTTTAYREPLGLAYPDAWRKWSELIGMRRSHYRGPAAKRDVGPRRKVAVLSDCHVPVHDPNLLADWFLANADADLCVGVGDLSDSWSVSQFHVDPADRRALGGWREEFGELQVVVEELSNTFPETIFVIGNHDRRLAKRVRDANLSQDAVDAIVSLAGTLDPVKAIARGFQNVRIADHAIPGTIPPVAVDWFTVVGSDCWVGHGEGYSRVAGTHVRKTAEYLSQNWRTVGLEQIPRLVLCAHTHQLSRIYHHADQLLCETGCLVATQRYMLGPASVRGGGSPPQRRGYVKFEQVRETGSDGIERWVTDLNSVQTWWYDVDRRFYQDEKTSGEGTT